jgi:hypothetical protein
VKAFVLRYAWRLADLNINGQALRNTSGVFANMLPDPKAQSWRILQLAATRLLSLPYTMYVISYLPNVENCS